MEGLLGSCTHRWEPLENRGGAVIAQQCGRCTLVADVHGNSVSASARPWALIIKLCPVCNMTYHVANAYAEHRRYCDKHCRCKAKVKRARERRQQSRGKAA